MWKNTWRAHLTHTREDIEDLIETVSDVTQFNLWKDNQLDVLSQHFLTSLNTYLSMLSDDDQKTVLAGLKTCIKSAYFIYVLRNLTHEYTSSYLKIFAKVLVQEYCFSDILNLLNDDSFSEELIEAYSGEFKSTDILLIWNLITEGHLSVRSLKKCLERCAQLCDDLNNQIYPFTAATTVLLDLIFEYSKTLFKK